MKRRDIFKDCPRYQNKNLCFRKISRNDVDDLFEIYSDAKSALFFNSDGCNGDTFYYDSIDKMKNAVKFWCDAYKNGWFVRLTIVDRIVDKAIGTLEICHRKSVDSFDNCVIIRIDLKSEYERYDIIDQIIKLTVPIIIECYGKKRIITKGFDDSVERIDALKDNGFYLSKRKLIANDNKEYGNYYVLKV